MIYLRVTQRERRKVHLSFSVTSCCCSVVQMSQEIQTSTMWNLMSRFHHSAWNIAECVSSTQLFVIFYLKVQHTQHTFQPLGVSPSK